MPRIKLSEFLDKLVLLCAMLLFAWVGITAIYEVRYLDAISGQGRPLLSEQTVNAPRYEASAPRVAFDEWKPPGSQSRGKEWVFDLFTPPVIYYDPDSQEFAVTPPNMQPEDDGSAQWAVFDLELLEVRLRPYRLQLVGYAGSSGDYVAYFEKTSTGELVLLREGQEEPELGVRLVSFQEQRVQLESEESMPVLQNVGVARLFDLSSDQEVSLTNLETKMFSDLEARVKAVPDGAVYLVKPGSRIELESGEYLIADLSASPQEAIITKVSKDGSRRLTKTLTPISDSALSPKGSRPPASGSPFAIRPESSSEKPSS